MKVDSGSGKITVTGKVDPLKLREKLEEKTHKKVELLSPVPKKDKAKNDDAGDGKEEKKKDSKEKKPKDNSKNKKDEKNSKEVRCYVMLCTYFRPFFLTFFFCYKF